MNRPDLSQLENVVLAKASDGNFIMAESTMDLDKIAAANPGMLPERCEIMIGRVERGKDGRYYARFDGFNLYV